MNKTSHPIDELELMAYLDGELPRERAAAAAVHLEDCRECQAIANDLKSVSQELGSWQITPSDSEITPQILIALDEHARKQESAPRRRARRWITFPRMRWVWASGAIATAAILFLSTFVFHGQLSYFVPKDDSSAREQNRTLALPMVVDKDHRSASPSGPQTGLIGKVQSDEDQSHGGRELAVPAGPMIIRTAELTLTATNFEQVRAKLEDILKRHNGYLGELSVTGSAESAHSLTATLRIPADKLDAAIAELKKLGKVEAESQKGEEVSQQYIDLQARLKNARNTEETLLDILRHRTGGITDVLAVEQEIARVREQIERMEAERKSLEKQVAFSTVNLRVAEDYKQPVHVVPTSTSRRIRDAAVEGYETLVAGLINLLLFVVSWGPSLLVWGAILFFPARMLWKRWRNRQAI